MMYDVLSPAGISNATGLSRDGKYLVGSRYESAGPASGVILHVDAAGTPSTVFSQANIVLNEVNSSGVAVGARGEDPQRWIAVFVDSNQKVNDLPLTRESGWAANSINEAGLVCGGGQSQESGAESRSFVCDANRNKIIRWIDPLPRNQWSFARAINEDGNVAGTCGDPLPALSVVFREETDGVKDLGLGRFGGLNSSGIVCGTLFTGADYPGYFTVAPGIWPATHASPAELPLPRGFFDGEALGINKYGTVVGSAWSRSGRSAFIWYSPYRDEGTDVNTLISDLDWQLDVANDISDNGQIIGSGRYQGNPLSAFLLTPQPDHPVEPPRQRVVLSLPTSFDQPIGNLVVGGGGWILGRGHPPIPVPPPGGWRRIDDDTRAALMGLVLDELARYLPDAAMRQTARTQMLDSVQASLDRLRQSVAESQPGGRCGGGAGQGQDG